MIKIAMARLQQKHRTIAYPASEPVLPERFRGLPVLDGSRCAKSCAHCVDACPVGAITAGERGPVIDLGKCLFCLECMDACPQKAISFSNDYRLAVREKKDLMFDGHALKLAAELDRKARSLFGHSLKLREVSAGGCNACEADVNVLGTVVFDLGRFGIQFVASPRHADGLVITGPVTRNMAEALKKTYDAVPKPKIVIAVGACAISGGPYLDHPEVRNGAEAVVPVDLFVPGCPPHPLSILNGLLRILGRLNPSA